MSVPPVSAICDVLALWGIDGWLSPPLVPIVAAATPIVGGVRIVTIEIGESGPGMSPIYDFLSNDLSGMFVVMAGAYPLPGAVFGEILGRAANQQGCFGALVDGGVRDRPALSELAMPVYAINERVAGPNGVAHVVGIDVAAYVGATLIDPRDHIVVDATGCVRIPFGQDQAVLAAAQRYAAAEDLVAASIAEGEPLGSAYRHKKHIVEELRR